MVRCLGCSGSLGHVYLLEGLEMFRVIYVDPKTGLLVDRCIRSISELPAGPLRMAFRRPEGYWQRVVWLVRWFLES